MTLPFETAGISPKRLNRRHFIGGSDARMIMGADEAALLRLWREKRGEVEPEDLSGNLIVQLGLEHGAGLFNRAVKGRRHPADHRVLDPPLYLRNDAPGIALEPMPIERLGHEAKLHDEIAGEVLRLGLAAFLAPQPQQGSLVAPHY